MAQIVAEFFNIIGVNAAAPATMAELIPYLLVVYIGVFLVSQVFRLLFLFLQMIFGMMGRGKGL